MFDALESLRESLAPHYDVGREIGVGGMACPRHHGAWADREALQQLRARLENAAAIHHESPGAEYFTGRSPWGF